MDGIVINEDNSHFFGTRSADDMTAAGLRAFIDQYAGTSVTHLFLCPNAMRANFRSKTRDAIWDPAPNGPPQGDKHGANGAIWAANARLLHEQGLDPYAVWIARAREKGISPWLSMRMNDVHCVDDPDNFMHSTFWREHPQWRRVPEPKSNLWFDRALNFAVPQVRRHAMSFVEELLDRYDPDGLELDWMRFGRHFSPAEEAGGAEVLAGFMREARRIVNTKSRERGHEILLGARVPANPDAARGLGMDGVRWAREGLIDLLVPAPFWSSSDFDIPIELWRERIGDGAKVAIAPCLEHNLRAYPAAPAEANDLESARGFAASAWARGADAIYLFNWMDAGTRPVAAERYRELLEQGLGPDVVRRKPRRHVQCYRDTVPAGFDAGIALPAACDAGAMFRLHTGPAPRSGKVHFVAGLSQRPGGDDAELTLRVNGRQCERLPDAEEPVRFPGAARAVRFVCPPEAIRPGYNEAELRQEKGLSQEIVWAEFKFFP